LASADPALLAPFVERLGSVPECKLDVEALAGAIAGQFGTIARIDASDDLSFDLLVLPTGESGSPLWQPFSARALGAIVLLSHGTPVSGAAALLGFLCREQEMPVVLPGLTELPAELAQLAPSATPAPPSPGEVLRELLALAARVRPRAMV
jgi:hypothetical protein